MRKKYLTEIYRRLKKGDIRWLLSRSVHALSIPCEALTKKCLTGPVLTCFAITYRCNERCLYCELPSRIVRGDEPSTGEMKRLIDQLVGVGASSVSFFGGEPLLRDDITELVSHAHLSNLSTNITTNGILLAPSLAGGLIEAGLDSLNVSLDSCVREYVNEIRNTPGAFDGAVNAIRAMAGERRKKSSHTPNISISTVLTSYNCSTIDDILNFAGNTGADSVYFNVMEVFPGAVDSKGSERYLERREELAAALKHLTELRSKNPFIDNTPRYLAHLRQYVSGEYPAIECYAGYHSLFLDCYGNIYPCYYFFQANRPSANIREIVNLREFWRSREYDRIRKELLECRECFFGCQMEMNEIYSLMRRKS